MPSGYIATRSEIGTVTLIVASNASKMKTTSGGTLTDA